MRTDKRAKRPVSSSSSGSSSSSDGSTSSSSTSSSSDSDASPARLRSQRASSPSDRRVKKISGRTAAEQPSGKRAHASPSRSPKRPRPRADAARPPKGISPERKSERDRRTEAPHQHVSDRQNQGGVGGRASEQVRQPSTRDARDYDDRSAREHDGRKGGSRHTMEKGYQDEEVPRSRHTHGDEHRTSREVGHERHIEESRRGRDGRREGALPVNGERGETRGHEGRAGPRGDEYDRSHEAAPSKARGSSRFGNTELPPPPPLPPTGPDSYSRPPPQKPSREEDWGPPRKGGDGPKGGGRGGGPDGSPPKAIPEPKPNMGLSGKLAAETNTVGGVVLKHTPPPESATPTEKWRLYVYKGNTLLDEPYYIHRNTHYLIGRERKICDIPLDHPSISKQHAVLQFRAVDKPNEYGVNVRSVKPYLIDLDSVNGTFLNGERLEGSRYYELLPKDVITFGMSSREFILLHDKVSVNVDS